jgi:DNA repair protein SbcD/Mre11
MSSSKLGLSDDKLAERREDFRHLVQRIPGLVQDKNVDIVLLPGDLFDTETVDKPEQLKDFRLLYEILYNIKAPVMITPGNHDYYSPSSFYHPDKLQHLLSVSWPGHVHIFDKTRFETKSIAFQDGEIQVTGRAFHDNSENTVEAWENNVRLLAELTPRTPVPDFNLLLFHGSRDDYNRSEHKMTAAFSKSELLALNFDYVAVGHYHRKDIFTNASGEIKGAYAGCPFARGLDETGKKVVLIGELHKSGTDPATVSLEEIELDPREIIYLRDTLSEFDTPEEIETRIQGKLSAVAKSQDILYLILQGSVQPGTDFSAERLATTLSQQYFHVKLDTSKLTESYDRNRFREDPHSLEGRFLLAIEEKIAAASPEERPILEEALYIGLDAITGRRVRTP